MHNYQFCYIYRIYIYIYISGHSLDLFCVRPTNAASFCENYARLYFDAKHLEKGLNRWR